MSLSLSLKRIRPKWSYHKGLQAEITTAEKRCTGCWGSRNSKNVSLLQRFRGAIIHISWGNLKHTPTTYLPPQCKQWHNKEMLFTVCLWQPTHKCTHYHQEICSVTAHSQILPLRPGNVSNNNSGNCSSVQNVTCVRLRGIVLFISRSSAVHLKQAPVWGLVPVLPDSYTYNEACWHHSIG